MDILGVLKVWKGWKIGDSIGDSRDCWMIWKVMVVDYEIESMDLGVEALMKHLICCLRCLVSLFSWMK